MTSILIKTLTDFLAKQLDLSRSDYCPNGLQVLGKPQIKHLCTGVTASIALIEKARTQGADALLVHHGIFWDRQSPVLVGRLQQQVKLLLEAEINLLAYHIPLDVHPAFGNAVMLAQKLGLMKTQPRLKGLIQQGELVPLTLNELNARIQKLTGLPTHLVCPSPERKVSRIALCPGAGQSFMSDAIAMDAEVFISGELSEPAYQMAQETDCAYIAMGHYASERYGVASLGDYLSDHFKITHEFIDLPIPV